MTPRDSESVLDQLEAAGIARLEATGVAWCTEKEFADLIAVARAAEAHRQTLSPQAAVALDYALAPLTTPSEQNLQTESEGA